MNAAARQPQERRLTRVADRSCSRPGCAIPAVATLLMRYADQEAVLTDLTAMDNPELYDLCAAHGDRTRPPLGWTLEDERSDDVVVVDRDMPRSVDDTVALLAAALHPEAAAEPLSIVRDGTDTVDDVARAMPEDEAPASAAGEAAEFQDDDVLEDEVDDRLFVPGAPPPTSGGGVRRGWRVPAADRR